MKKLLIITDMFPDESNFVGGIFVQQQAEALTEFYEVKVISSYFPSNPKVVRNTSGKYEVVHCYYPQSKIVYPLTSISYWRYVIPQIRQVIDKWQPDIIHVHDCRHVPELLCLSRLFMGYHGKRFLTLHNVKTLPEKAERQALKHFYAMTLKMTLRGWNHVFVVSQRLRERLSTVIPLNASSHIGNAITCLEYSQVKEEHANDTFKIVSVGNLVRTKGFDLLIRSVAALLHDGRQVTLDIVGSGPERNRLKSLVSRLGLVSNVRMHNALPNDKVRELFPLFDAFVLPSYSETFGIVYLEAMDAGIPVVGVIGQGIDGVIENGVSGLLSLPYNVKDITAKITWLMDHPEQAREMGQRGQELVQENYRMSGLISKLREQYEA